MPNEIVYVLINGELDMSAGKAAAQAVHAAAMLKNIGSFGKQVQRTVIILEAENTQQLLNLHLYLSRTGLESQYYIDEGVNEVDAYSITALAVGPIWSEDKEERELLASFPLFPSNKNARLNAYRSLKTYRWELVDGLEDNSPWFLRKTLKWLKKNK